VGFIWGLFGQKRTETHEIGLKQKAKKPHCNAIFLTDCTWAKLENVNSGPRGREFKSRHSERKKAGNRMVKRFPAFLFLL